MSFFTFFFGVVAVQKMHSSLTNRGAKLAYWAALLLMATMYIVFQAASLFRFPQAHSYTLIYYQLCTTLTDIKLICNKRALQVYRFSLRAFSEDVKHCSRRTIPVQARGLA